MNIKPESEMILEEEFNLYDYWEILLKRKRILIAIFLVPVVIVATISLSLPRYYRGESEITIPALPSPEMTPATTAPKIASVITAANIVRLIGDIDEAQKVKIFADNSSAIKKVSLFVPKTSADKISVLIDAKTPDILPQATKALFGHMGNLPVVKDEIARTEAENALKTKRFIAQADLKIEKLEEAKKANLIFLKYINEMMNKKQISMIYFNPAGLIRNDADLSLELMNLRQEKEDILIKKTSNVKIGILGPLSIKKHPSNGEIAQRIIIAGLLSLLAGIFFVFSLGYLERIKARKR